MSESLCNFYLGNAENCKFSAFLKHRQEFFIRIVDDYVYMTPTQGRAQTFWRKMQAGIRDYHIRINKGKSEHNWESKCGVPRNDNRLGCTPVTFCGWRFCLNSGHVSRDYSSYCGQDMASSITFFMRDVPPAQ